MTLHQTTNTTTAEEEADPVADFISALILSGEYRPDAYGIPDEAFTRWRKVHEYCKEMYAVTGGTMSTTALARNFPNFPLVTDIPIEWAAHELHGEYLKSRLTKTAATMSMSLINDDAASAYQTMVEANRSIQPTMASPVDVLDQAVLSEVPPPPCPVSEGALKELTGGIRPGELWYVGARPGRGKTWDLVRHATAAALGGWDVCYFSMEMSIKQISDRYLAIAHSWKQLNAWSLDALENVAKEMRSSRGRFRVIDPSIRRCDTMAVAAQAKEHTLLVVDHVGLMRSGTGSRSVEDYRVAASISNELKEIALQFKVPIIAASQLNRRSESKGDPSLSDLAQTDASGQDADLVYAITAANGSRVQQCTVVKNRNGRSGVRWYVDFKPSHPSFTEISQMKARAMLEEEFASSAEL